VKLEDEIPAATKDPTWEALYAHLRERVSVHVASAVRRNIRYKRMANFLHIVIPAIALCLTIAATSAFLYSHEITAGLAIGLTVLTGLNSILEPGRRYVEQGYPSEPTTLV
jgi:hypothetical protein